MPCPSAYVVPMFLLPSSCCQPSTLQHQPLVCRAAADAETAFSSYNFVVCPSVCPPSQHKSPSSHSPHVGGGSPSDRSLDKQASDREHSAWRRAQEEAASLAEFEAGQAEAALQACSHPPPWGLPLCFLPPSSRPRSLRPTAHPAAPAAPPRRAAPPQPAARAAPASAQHCNSSPPPFFSFLFS